MAKKLTYKSAGVDIIAAEKLWQGLINKEKKQPKSFAALYPLPGIKNKLLAASADGVGTKLKLAQQLNKHNTIGIDLVAMNVNDILCLGAKPLFFLDYIACGKINRQILRKVMQGIIKGLAEAETTLLGGETAEMPGMYKKDEYDLAGFAVGLVDRDKVLKPRKIREKDIILGISSSGIHSNGYSLVRKVFTSKEIKKYSSDLLSATRIYVKPIIHILEKFKPAKEIKAIAHITGGSFYRKAVNIIPSGLAMAINKNSWPKHSIFNLIQDKGKIEEKEMFTVFNMGIGMILVVKPSIQEKVCEILNNYYPSYKIGEIVKSSKEKIYLV